MNAPGFAPGTSTNDQTNTQTRDKRFRKKNMFLRIAARLSAFYALICIFVFAIQRSLLYFPSHDPPSGPLVAWTDQGNLIGYCRRVPNPKNVWLMLHGNAGQASYRDYVLPRLSPTDAFYVLEYPGYGARPGRPSRQSFDQAAADAYYRLAQQYPHTPLCVIAESIGSGPASTLAHSSRPPDKIVLVAPFDTLQSVASRRFFFLPVWLMLLDRWNNIDSLRHYGGVIDIYGAQHDTVIPIQHARNLAQHVPQANFLVIPCGHNDWSMMDQVRIER